MDNKKLWIHNFELRIIKLSKKIIRLCRMRAYSPALQPILRQLIRSGTSIGANYMEANAAQSPRDFIHKVEVARKEAKETMYWLDLLNEENKSMEEVVNEIATEVKNIFNILGAMCKNTKEKMNSI